MTNHAIMICPLADRKVMYGPELFVCSLLEIDVAATMQRHWSLDATAITAHI